MAGKKYPWDNRVRNPAQIGGIETSVLNDGLGRCVRIACVNTGSVAGLDADCPQQD